MEIFLTIAILSISFFTPYFSAPNVFLPMPFTLTEIKSKCAFKTYLADPDPDGTNIRAQSDRNSVVLKHIKSENDVIVNVIGYSNEWFEINKMEEIGTAETVIFRGRGWIHSALLGMRVADADARLYSRAEKSSAILLKLKPEENEVKLIACQNNWVKIQTAGKIGWLSPSGQCGNPLTTCP